MEELMVTASADNLERVRAFVSSQLDAVDCPLKTCMQISVAVEEVFTNIACYAYAPDTGNVLIQVEIHGEENTAEITFLDKGVPYDPLDREDPDVSLSAEDREIGGLGIFLAKKLMDEMRYAHSGGQNILTLKKSWETVKNVEI